MSDTESKPLDPKPWVDLNDVRWAYENAPYDTFDPGPEFEQDRSKYEREA